MTQWIDHPIAQALASALLHFLWQGSALALLVLAWWRVGQSASSRYIAGVITLAAMLVAPIATVLYLSRQSPVLEASGRLPSELSLTLAPESRSATLPAADDAGGAERSDISLLTPGRSLILPLWLAGVLVLSGRLAGGWMVVRRLTRRHAAPVAPEIAAMAARVASRLALDRAVQVVESSIVAVPVMVGWLKPVVLIPTAVLAGLTPQQVEALLAHELAHVRRQDYLVNLLQSLVETLLFYHPAVWWVSRQVRDERERCCDDLAVSVCDRVTYVTALTDLASLGAGPRILLAATDGSLLGRVRRLLGHAHSDRPAGGVWVPVLLFVLAAMAFLPDLMASPVEQSQIVGPVEGGVSETVAGGDQGGARGGVAGGVGGGVPGGVAGGAPGGVAGGAPGGVGGGVPGGVPGSVAETQEPDTRRQPASTQTKRRELEVGRAELLELLKREQSATEQYMLQQGEMEKQRLELELRAVQADLEASRTEQEIELRNLQRELERVKGQVEIGVADPTELARITNALKVAESRLHATQSERDARLGQAMLQIEAAKHKREYEKRQLEIEHARRRVELERDAEERVRLGLQQPQGEDRAAMERRTLEKILQAALKSDLETTVVADQRQPIVTGDVLSIEIAGEPALPRAYRVGEDGVIRLPLLGSVEARGRTADQVRDEIRRVLMDRRLKEDPVVTVTRRQKP